MASPAGNEALLRIGELSRRAGVSDHVLRAWESRYGLLRPVRSDGGFRLYSHHDADRIDRMKAYLAEGLSAAEAARAVLREDEAAPQAPTPATGPDPTATSLLAEGADAFRQALDTFDEPAADAALDRLVAEFALTTVLRDVVLPYLAALGERWKTGEASVAQEHFASNVIRGRLAGFARGWGSGDGPCAVLACPPEELHDLPLLIFGIVLSRRGWRIRYLGTSTPVAELDAVVETLRPDLVVVSAPVPHTLAPLRRKLTTLARRAPLALAGGGATAALADAVGARLLTGDPVTEAERIGRSG